MPRPVWKIRKPSLLFPVILALCVLSWSGTTVLASSTTVHEKLEGLAGPFTTGPQVTKACLECHTEASKQVHQTKHWTWSFTNPDTGQELGKKNVINNFCISTVSNTETCASCHVGYGMKDDSFDFSSEENVDCLVCHDTTGTYDKKRLMDGKSLNLKKIAQNVGPTSRETCGTCHFKGGGGKAVKHGDLDPGMVSPDGFVDVHMDADGLNFGCSTCHSTDAHMITGSRYQPLASDHSGIDIPGKTDGTLASCTSCHGDRPMKDEKLNDHTDKIACQTCHIPLFARGDYATKTWWDWSTAGQMDDDGKPFVRLDHNGLEVYNSKKGDFDWQRDVVPTYRWFNGKVDYTLPADTIDPDQIVSINTINGSADDPDSKIWPFKVMRGKQPYDTENRTFAIPHTTGEDGYWKTFDWQEALRKGMAAADIPYSGNYGFVETEMSWPLAHMVAPATEALTCEECHSSDGRMAGIEGVYIPGRDSLDWLDMLGFGLLGLTGAGVGIHGLLRFIFRRKTIAASKGE